LEPIEWKTNEIIVAKPGNFSVNSTATGNDGLRRILDRLSPHLLTLGTAASVSGDVSTATAALRFAEMLSQHGMTHVCDMLRVMMTLANQHAAAISRATPEIVLVTAFGGSAP